MQDAYAKLKAHADASRASGKPDLEAEQALSMYAQKNPQAAQAPATPDIKSLLQQAHPSAGQSLANALSVLGGGKPVYDQQDSLENQYKMARINYLNNKQGSGSVNSPTTDNSVDGTNQTPEVPEGFVVVGNRILKDPNYVTPEDQRRIDVENENKKNYEESLKESAKANLNTIKEVKEGAKYFGPFGDLPSTWAPSSLMGEYGSRQEWETNVNKLLSQKVIDVMREMKNSSKTGSTGFGALSQKELTVLQEASTALNKKLMPQDALKYLNEMETIHKKVLGIQNQNSFNSPGEADSSGLPAGTIVKALNPETGQMEDYEIG